MLTKMPLRTLSAALVVVAVVLIVTLVLAPGAWAASKYKTLYKFTGGADGNYPYYAGLIFDQAGNLYGTTVEGGDLNDCYGYGCGTVFQLTPNGDGSWMESVIHSFHSDDTGANPFAGLIFDHAGNLYGTTLSSVFKLTPNGDGSWTESLLHSFTGRDGWELYACLIFDPAGNLYGTTRSGGTYGDGTVFQLTPNTAAGWTERVLHHFNGGNDHHQDGWAPMAGLTLDLAGNLYGTTSSGGAGDAGTVFQLTHNKDGSWTESLLHSFNGNDGFDPFASLIFDQAGNLYGTTESNVFKLTPNGDGSWTESVLHSFNGKDGLQSFACLIFDPAGNLYGTTASGGAYGNGTVFKLKPTGKGGWKETVLHSFNNNPGAAPFAGLIFDGHGSLYGTTQGKTRNKTKTYGSVFEITP
jgi:uncharacterized repeat protein (TIGR03803 family)